MKTFLSQFRRLPQKNQKMIGIAVTVFLLLSTPLLLWGFLTGNFDLRERAGSGPITPPGTPPAQTPLVWAPTGTTIMADDFYITYGEKFYTGHTHDSYIEVLNITNNSYTFEATSNKYGDNLKLRINFKKDSQSWWIESVQVYNSNYADKWITYTTWTLQSPLGQAYTFNGVYDFELIDPFTNQSVAHVHFRNLLVRAFYDLSPTSTPSITPSGSPMSSPSASPTISASPSPSSSPTPKEGDVNSDGLVNIVDIGIIVDHYRTTPPGDIRADLNNDGTVNIVDIGIVINNYGS